MSLISNPHFQSTSCISMINKKTSVLSAGAYLCLASILDEIQVFFRFFSKNNLFRKNYCWFLLPMHHEVATGWYEDQRGEALEDTGSVREKYLCTSKTKVNSKHTCSLLIHVLHKSIFRRVDGLFHNVMDHINWPAVVAVVSSLEAT